MNYNGQISSRSLNAKHQYPDVVQGLTVGIKNYVTSIFKESVESYCLSPGKVCVAGPQGPKGIEGPKGSTGNKGQKGIQHQVTCFNIKSCVTYSSLLCSLPTLPFGGGGGGGV